MKRILFIVVLIFCCIISDVYSRDNSIEDGLNGYLTDGVVLPHSLLGSEVNQNEENYFSYVFKRQFGVSPSKYRTEHTESEK